MNNYFKITSTLLTVLLFLLMVGIFLIYTSIDSEKKAIHFVSKNDDRIQVGFTDKPTNSHSKLKKSEEKKKKKKEQKAEPKKEKVKEKEKEEAKEEKPKEKPKEKVKEKVEPKEEPKEEKPEPKKVESKKVPKEKPKIVEPKKIEKEVKKEKKKLNMIVTEKPKLKSLFDDIKEKKPKNDTLETSSEKAQDNEKSEETSEKSFDESQKRDQGIVDAYFAKVEETLYYWPALSEFAGEKAEVWLRIRRDGSFDFKLIKLSNNQDFNSGLIQYLEQLQKVGFAVHKSDKPYEANVEFVAEE